MPRTALHAGSTPHFIWPLRVYWEDTDAGGVVFYANYLRYFERARTEWLRALGLAQQALRNEQRLMFVVADLQLRYLAPARLDDQLQIGVQLVERSRVRLVLAQTAWLDGRPLCAARVTVACVDADRLVPRAMPAALQAVLPQPGAAVAPAAPAVTPA
ncbi:MAG: tol-pal system-associated acyl-CoA thioesterase [Pseudomonadota bacterium]|jgi:acyl-CoA thioester hydrolase